MGWNGDYESEAYGVDSSSSSTSTSTSTDNGNDNGNDNRQAYTDRFGGTSTRNFNVNTSQPSVTEGGRTTYGSREQLNDLFGPSDTNDTVGGMGFSFGGGRTTMAQMAGYAGKMSPTTVGGYGISAGRGSLGIAEQSAAYNRAVGTYDPDLGWTRGTLSTGMGLSKPTVVDIDMATGKIRSVTPGTVGLAEGQRSIDRTQMTTEQVSKLATAMGYGYAGQMTDPAMSGVTVGGPIGVEADKAGYVGYGTGTDVNFARVTGEEIAAESAIGGMGIAGAALVGFDPDFAEVTELGTGRVGTYSDVGGIAGLMEGGPKVGFPDGSETPDTGDNGDSPYVNVAQYRTGVGAPRPRFRSRQQFSPIRSMRFPSAPSPNYGRAPVAYAAEGGYIQGTDYLQKGLDNKLPGFHAMQFGGKVYAVSPDEKDPTQFRAYGGTMNEVKAAFGGAFGYDPSTIDFTKQPGEPGFGTDLKGFVPGMGGLNNQNQFVNANGILAQNSADPFLDKYRKQMKIGGLAGFVGARPEQLDDGKTIADDVPMDVPEGTFVLNAAAVEFMGSADVEKMLQDALAKAQALGVDISGDSSKMTGEGSVPLAVSAGEVIIPPVLAKIIGYDRLEKINNRGKQEVQKRQAESESRQQGAPVEQQMAAIGGRIAKKTGGVSEVDDKAFTYPPISRNEFFDSTEYDEDTRIELYLLHADLGREYKDFLVNTSMRNLLIDDTYGKKSEDNAIRKAAANDEEFLAYQERARGILSRAPENIRNLYMSMHEDAKLDLLNSLQYDQDTGASEWANDVAAQYAMIPLGAFNTDTIPGTGALGIQIGGDSGESPTTQVAVAGRADPSVAVHEGRHLSRGNIEEDLSDSSNVDKYGSRDYKRSEFFTDVVLPDGRKLMLTEEQVLRIYDIQDAKKREDSKEANSARKFIVGHKDFGGRAMPALVLGKNDLSLEELKKVEDDIYSQLETLNLFGEYPEFGSRSSSPDYPYDQRILPREWSDDGKRRPQSTIGSPTSDQKKDEGIFGLGFLGL